MVAQLPGSPADFTADQRSRPADHREHRQQPPAALRDQATAGFQDPGDAAAGVGVVDDDVEGTVDLDQFEPPGEFASPTLIPRNAVKRRGCGGYFYTGWGDRLYSQSLRRNEQPWMNSL